MVTSYRPYTGIGSRSTPKPILYRMREIAGALAISGWTLRSGAAEGADRAFSDGVTDACVGSEVAEEIYIPWPGFVRWQVPLMLPTPLAFEIAARFHPGWAKLTRGPRALHARNVHQVLGRDCDSPSRFVLCWTPDGADVTSVTTTSKTGGTGQAIRIAAGHGVEVVNMQRDGWETRLAELTGLEFPL